MKNNKTKKTGPSGLASKVQTLTDLVQYSQGSIVSRTIVDKPQGTITIFAFDKGQKLSAHQAPFDAVVQIIDGSASITIGKKKLTVSAGQLVIMPANVPHAVEAKQNFKMALTMIRS